MTVKLRPMTGDEMDEWLAVRRGEYIADRVEIGEDADEARRIADTQYAELLPDDRPPAGQFLYRVVDDSRPVGWLWIGVRGPDPSAFWVWDVKIAESEQGKGYGRAAMLLAEDAARENGAKVLGLNVFGHNAVARHLYESMDYTTMSLQMSKDL
jgi:GNAT superfamily N-acetyltransferase